MTTYTTTADENGDFNIAFGKAYNGGESITVRSTKMGQSKEILLNAPVGEYEPLPPIINEGSIIFTGSVVDFPNNIGGMLLQMQGEIGDLAFYGSDQNFFKNVTSLSILNGVTSIGYQSFYNWTWCKSLFIAGSVKTIENFSFYNWISCEHLVLENGLESIGQSAFGGWSSCKFLTIPSSVIGISRGAFDYWSSCQEINVLAVTPPSTDGNPFSDLPTSCVIKVPQASLSAYQTAPNWSQYASQMIGI